MTYGRLLNQLALFLRRRHFMSPLSPDFVVIDLLGLAYLLLVGPTGIFGGLWVLLL